MLISSPLVIGILIIAIVIFYFMYSRARMNFRDWEVNFLSKQAGIPTSSAKEVIEDSISVEHLESKAWARELKLGIKAQDDKAGQVEKYMLEDHPIGKTYLADIGGIQDEFEEFHIIELVSEPKHYINSSHADAWVYRSNGEISQLLLAGHANSAVCKQISSLIYNTYLNMDDIGMSLLVPGACYLQSRATASKIDIHIHPPNSTNTPRIKRRMPIEELVASLSKDFQDSVGLTTVHFMEDVDYGSIQNSIFTRIQYAQKRGDRVYIISDRSHKSGAFLVPYFTLNTNELDTLYFDLPISVFQSDDFVQLKEIHRQSLILEMTDDALRRKRIYQEWLEDDQDKYKKYGEYYRSLPSEKQKAKNVHISGTRDYFMAIIRKPSADGQEVYTSPQEYYEKILPILLSEDQRWIDRMDDLMSSINSLDQERDHRLNELNLAVLIDSFLRGWPPVFLGGEEDESRQRYIDWCNKKRAFVWQVIYCLLESRSIRIDPLLEKNTIFHIKFVGDDVLRFTPLHLTTEGSLDIYVSKELGIPFYIDQWSRRKLKQNKVPSDKNRLLYAKEYYDKGANLLAIPNPSESSEDKTIIEQAVNSFKLALEINPAIIQEIWNGWWEAFGKDTSKDFERFKNLVRGFRAHHDADFEAAKFHFNEFVSHYPDYLPDPYMLMAIEKQEELFGISPLLVERSGILEQNTIVQEKLKSKYEFLNSNQELVEKINHLGDLSLDKGDRQKISEIARISMEVKELSEELATLNEVIANLNQRISAGYQSVWKGLKSSDDEFILKAKNISRSYVDKIFEVEKFENSEQYLFRFRHIHEILQGDDFLEIANRLYRTAIEIGQKKIAISKLRTEIIECLQAVYLGKDELQPLINFKEKLESLNIEEDESISPIVRELVLKKELEQISKTFYQNGFNKYKQPYMLPEFVEPLKRLAELYTKNQISYRRALHFMFKSEIPLRNFSPKGKFTPLSKEEINLTQVVFDRANMMLSGIDKSGRELDLASVENLSDEEQIHLEQEISSPKFIHKPSIGINTAEKVLNKNIKPSPCSMRWSRSLSEIEGWLIRLIAYLNICPIPNDSFPEGEFYSLIERQSILSDIDLNKNRIQCEFFKQIDVNQEDATFISLSP